MTALALHGRSPRPRRVSAIPASLMRDLLAIGWLTEHRPSAQRRLESRLAPETLANVRRLLDIR